MWDDHVTIYPNSTILGGETLIGDHSTIGANVFLMHSVAANSLVVQEISQLTILDKTAKHKKSAVGMVHLTRLPHASLLSGRQCDNGA